MPATADLSMQSEIHLVCQLGTLQGTSVDISDEQVHAMQACNMPCSCNASDALIVRADRGRETLTEALLVGVWPREQLEDLFVAFLLCQVCRGHTPLHGTQKIAMACNRMTRWHSNKKGVTGSESGGEAIMLLVVCSDSCQDSLSMN